MRAFCPTRPPASRIPASGGATVAFTITPSTETPVAGEDVTWSTNAASLGTPIVYEWDFGDGTIPTNGATPTHYFVGPGPYTVTCTVTYDDLTTDTDTQLITLQGDSTFDLTNEPYLSGTDLGAFSSGSWIKSGASVTANAGVAPDGATTADSFSEGATGTHYQYRTIATTAGTDYTFVFYAKYVDRRYIMFSAYTGVSTYSAMSIDLVSGIVKSTKALGAGFVVRGTSIYDIGSGWFRCAISFNAPTGTTNIELDPSDTGVLSTYGLPAAYTGTNATVLYWKPNLITGLDTYDPTLDYIGPVQDPVPTDTVSIPLPQANMELEVYESFEETRGPAALGPFDAWVSGTTPTLVPVGGKLKSANNVGWSASAYAVNWAGQWTMAAINHQFGMWVYFEALPDNTIQYVRVDSGSGQIRSVGIDSSGNIVKVEDAVTTTIGGAPIEIETWYWIGLAQCGSQVSYLFRELDGAMQVLGTGTTAFATSYIVIVGPRNISGNVAHGSRVSAITRHKLRSISDVAYPSEIIRPHHENMLYQIDPVNGDDANDGATAAWLTVTRANNMMLADNGIISKTTPDYTIQTGDWSATTGHAGVYQMTSPNPVAFGYVKIDGSNVIRNVGALAELDSTLYTQGEDAQYSDGRTVYLKPISNPTSDGRVYTLSYVGSGAHLRIDTSVERLDVLKEGLKLNKKGMKVYPIAGQTYVEYQAEVVVDAGDWAVTSGYTGIYETTCAEEQTRVTGDGVYFEIVDSLGLLNASPAGTLHIKQDVEGATNASPIVITATNHGLANGTQLTISKVVGNTAANGTFTIGSVAANTFELVGSVGNGAYTSGGLINTGKLYIKPYSDPRSDGKTYRYGRVRNTLTTPGVDTVGIPVVAAASNDLWVRGIRTLHTAVNNNGSYVFGEITGFTGKLRVENIYAIYTDKHAVCYTIIATDSFIHTLNAQCEQGISQVFTDYMGSGSGNIHEWYNATTVKSLVSNRTSTGTTGNCYYSHGGGGPVFARNTLLNCNWGYNNAGTEGAASVLEFLSTEMAWHQALAGTSLIDTCTLHAIPQLFASYTQSIVRNCAIDCGPGFQAVNPRTLSGSILFDNNTFDMTAFAGTGFNMIWEPSGALDLTFTNNTVTWGSVAPNESTALIGNMATADIVSFDNNTYHLSAARNFAYQFDDGAISNRTFAQWQALGYDTNSTRIDP